MIKVAGNQVSRLRIRCVGYSAGYTYICRGSRIDSDCDIGIGSRINGPILIKGRGKVTIGSYSAIGEDVRIISQNHNPGSPVLSLALQKRVYGRSSVIAKDVSVGSNVWIGDAVIVLPGVNVGDGSVVAAGSVVTRNVEPYTIVAGNPARVIRSRWKAEYSAMSECGFWGMTESEIASRLRDLVPFE